MQHVLDALRGQRIEISTEREVQRQIALVFAKAGIVYQREVKIAGGRIDFLVGDVGIEVKIDGSARAMHRQLRGYSGEGRIRALVLVTAKAVGMPPEIAGKPVTVFGLGGAWL